MSELHIVTVATESKYYFPYLVESCKKNGKDLKVLGFGEKWQGFNWRFLLMIDYLQNLPENDIVCFVDGYDVICTRNLNELSEVFVNIREREHCKIIAGHDKLAESSDFIKGFLAYFMQNFFFKKCKNESLNAGTYIGYAKDVLEIIQKIYNLNPTNNSDDQVLMIKYCNLYKNDFYLDVNNELFLAIINSYSHIDKDVTIENKTLTYKNRQPFFIHAPAFGFLDKIIIKLGYEYNGNVKQEYYKNLPNKFFMHAEPVFREFYYYILFFIFLILFSISFVYRDFFYNLKKKRKIKV